MATYTFAIPDYVNVRQVESSTNDAPSMDANDPNAKIITFRPLCFPWASRSLSQSSSEWCSAPWSVLQINVLRTSTGPSCALRI